jgi:hypothetical protein
MNVNGHAAEMNTSRLTGMGAIGTLALAVLVFGCVLAATAGPREALRTRTQALHQTLAPIPLLGQSIAVSGTWDQLISNIDIPEASFTNAQLTDLTGQFHADFSRGVLRLAPVSADWLSLTSSEQPVLTALSGTDHHAVEMEISYRLPLTSYVRVLAGSLSVPPPKTKRRASTPSINVAVTQQTADKFGLMLGSVVKTAGPVSPSSGKGTAIKFKVAAIVAERQPGTAFWSANPPLAAPRLNVPGTSPPYWTSGVFALPDESATVQQNYGASFMNVQWVLPIDAAADRTRVSAAARPAGATRERAHGQHRRAGRADRVHRRR